MIRTKSVCPSTGYLAPCLLIASLLVAAPSADAALMHLNDGGTHTVDVVSLDQYWVTNNSCFTYCWPTSEPATNLIVSLTGSISQAAVELYGTSTVTVIGGYVSSIEAYGETITTITGGDVPLGIRLDLGASANIFGGNIGLYIVDSWGDTVMTAGRLDLVSIAGDHTFTMSGGEAWEPVVMDTSKFILSGGYIMGQKLTVAGPGTTAEIIGAGFKLDGVAIPYGEIEAQTGWLSGELQDGGQLFTDNFLHVEHKGAGNSAGVITLVAGADDPDEDMLTSSFDEWVHGTNPDLWDTDGDGLGDGEEVFWHSTLPTQPDTDGDTYSDGVEIAAGSNPNDPLSFPEETGTPTVPSLPLPGLALLAMLLCASVLITHRETGGLVR